LDDLKTAMEQMEADLAALKHQYDVFFQGKRRGEPTKERKDLENRILVLSRRAITNNAEQLRFNNLKGRYWAFAHLWDRTVRDLEEGRTRRDSTGAVTQRQATPEPAVDPEHVDQVAERLLAARRECGLGGDPEELREVRDTLYARAKEISESAGGKKVEFRVSVEEGKPKVKAVLRK
jgi:hypothetical protein